jgi:hypothetical protein
MPARPPAAPCSLFGRFVAPVEDPGRTTGQQTEESLDETHWFSPNQAGVVLGSVNAGSATGRWVTAMTAVRSRERRQRRRHGTYLPLP